MNAGDGKTGTDDLKGMKGMKRVKQHEKRAVVLTAARGGPGD
jgi:hypothetical protein